MNIYVLYRDMRTYGERENLYKEARDKGVIFIRYELEKKPVVESLDSEDKLNVTVYDPSWKDRRSQSRLCLPANGNCGTNNQELADIFRVNLDRNGFFAESPEKMKPVMRAAMGSMWPALGLSQRYGRQHRPGQGRICPGPGNFCQDTIQVEGWWPKSFLKNAPCAAPVSGPALLTFRLSTMKQARPASIPVSARVVACAWPNVPERPLSWPHAAIRC